MGLMNSARRMVEISRPLIFTLWRNGFNLLLISAVAATGNFALQGGENLIDVLSE